MRIHFMVNGMGLGHVMRDLPIMRELSKRHYVSASSYGLALETLRKNGYRNATELPEVGDIALNKDKISIGGSLLKSVRKLQPDFVNRISALLLKERPDVVVVDGYLLGALAAKLLGKKVVCITNCTKVWYVFPKTHVIVERGTDLFSKAIIDVSERVIVPDFPPPFTVAAANIDYFGQEKKFRFVGPVVDCTRAKKGKKVLISMGGTGVASDGADIVADAIRGLGYGTVIANGKMDMAKVRRAIAAAPFVVFHGGHTSIMEAMCSGTPVICIPLKGYTERENNALGAQRLGFGVVLDDEWVDRRAVELAVKMATSKRSTEAVKLLAAVARPAQAAAEAAQVIEEVGNNRKCGSAFRSWIKRFAHKLEDSF
ncbi:MAG: glycosyltransferase family protein [Candidatus Micrarchaeia archaeon]